MLLRGTLLAGLAAYTAWLLVGYEFHLLDHANLAIHEAGHVLFLPFGQVASMWGGTLLQLAMPLLFAGAFLRRGRPFDAAVCGTWSCESLLDTAEYLADARLMRLPRVGGELHDWNWILARFGQVSACEEIAAVVRAAAGVGLVLCLVAAARSVLEMPPDASAVRTA